MRQTVHDEATKQRESARNHGFRLRLERRRNELVRRHHLDVLGIDEDTAGGGDNDYCYESDLQQRDATVTPGRITVAAAGAEVHVQGSNRSQKAFHWASERSKRQKEDHHRRVKRAARLAELGLAKLTVLQEQSLMGYLP